MYILRLTSFSHMILLITTAYLDICESCTHSNRPMSSVLGSEGNIMAQDLFMSKESFRQRFLEIFILIHVPSTTHTLTLQLWYYLFPLLDQNGDVGGWEWFYPYCEQYNLLIHPAAIVCYNALYTCALTPTMHMFIPLPPTTSPHYYTLQSGPVATALQAS